MDYYEYEMSLRVKAEEQRRAYMQQQAMTQARLAAACAPAGQAEQTYYRIYYALLARYGAG